MTAETVSITELEASAKVIEAQDYALSSEQKGDEEKEPFVITWDESKICLWCACFPCQCVPSHPACSCYINPSQCVLHGEPRDE